MLYTCSHLYQRDALYVERSFAALGDVCVSRQNNAVGYSGLGAVDTGATTDCAPDLDHTCLKVRRDIKKWMSWLFDDIGYGAIRIDMAPGYAPQYQVCGTSLYPFVYFVARLLSCKAGTKVYKTLL